jgi:hypothetical protein
MADSITLLEPLPSRVNRPETLDDDTERLFENLPPFARDIAAARDQAVAASEAGAGGYSFAFDLSTVAADPGNGVMRLNTANVALASFAYLNTVTSTGSNIAGLIDTFDDSDSGIKGTLRVVQARNAANWCVFKVRAVTGTNPTWRTLQLEHVSSSSNTPFQPGVVLALQYSPNGDRGEQGIPGSTVAAAVRADLHAMMLSF